MDELTKAMGPLLPEVLARIILEFLECSQCPEIMMGNTIVISCQNPLNVVCSEACAALHAEECVECLLWELSELGPLPKDLTKKTRTGKVY